MSKVFIQEDTLTNIANAIREKDGTTDPIAPQNMADAIINLPSGEELPEDYFVFTGDLGYTFTSNWNRFIDIYGNKIKTKDITNVKDIFYNNSKIKTQMTILPFEISNSAETGTNIQQMFESTNFIICPVMRNIKPINCYVSFGRMFKMQYFPDGFGDDWDFSQLNSNSGAITDVFVNNYVMRKIPTNFLKQIYSKSSSTQIYSNSFYNCYCLDEIIGLPVLPVATYSSYNLGSACFSQCFRVKDVIFDTEDDGSAKKGYWYNKTLVLTSRLGYGDTLNKIVNDSSNITIDKQVVDDATYQALKDDPDWFSLDVNYSRYNHDSAVRTINSLPDCSEYINANNYTVNTIKFKGQSGALTDGGAINTLTEEEIAVATVKGWTVSFT